jgi:hypothetical protein
MLDPAAATTTPGKAFPPPAGTLDITTVTLPAGQVLHRVHESRFDPLSFNPGFGRARFSPIRNASGTFIPTIYAGTTIPCALLESVFHDVPYAAGYKPFPRAKLRLQVHSELGTLAPLTLVDLGTIALRKLGIPRKQLIDTESSEYEVTQCWAAAFHAQEPAIQGIRWTSRQDDSATAVILFGDRIAAGALRQLALPRELDTVAYPDFLYTATAIGVSIVDARL